jgi:hypothetical protein
MQRQLRIGAVLDRVERIADQVDQHLFQAVRIARHGQMRLDVARDARPDRRHARFQQEQRIVDRLAEARGWRWPRRGCGRRT